MFFLRLFRNYCSVLLARRKYALSFSQGWNDFSISISLNKYRPSNVCTFDSTVYYQVLNSPTFGHDVIMMASLDMPWSLWPVVASLRLTGNWVIWQQNCIFVYACWWGFTSTATRFVCARWWFFTLTKTRFICDSSLNRLILHIFTIFLLLTAILVST